MSKKGMRWEAQNIKIREKRVETKRVPQFSPGREFGLPVDRTQSHAFYKDAAKPADKKPAKPRMVPKKDGYGGWRFLGYLGFGLTGLALGFDIWSLASFSFTGSFLISPLWMVVIVLLPLLPSLVALALIPPQKMVRKT